ncbi:MAG: hypothetical protein MUF87_01350 [Anaerolineae bacterium]|jgi:hypothetical protein|nr:hypothetical protein [Anaerolineae bacterium]
MRILNQLPEEARPNAPALRYVMGNYAKRARQILWLQLVVGIALVIGVGVIGGRLLSQDQGLPASAILMNALYPAAVLGQILMSVFMLMMTMGVINEEKRRQTWDNLRATDTGTQITLRARWFAAVFYRLFLLLVIIYSVRLALVGALLYDLTAFSGDYLALISGGSVQPLLPVEAIIILTAFSLTASFILPLTGLGLDAALGILLATFINHRVWIALTQMVLSIARFAMVIGLFLLMQNLVDPTNASEPFLKWISMVGFGGFGDWGLRFLNLQSYSELWSTVPFGIFVGVGMLLIAVIQAGLTELFLSWAARRAQARD